MFLFLSTVHTIRCCRAPTWVSSLVFLGSQRRESTSGSHFRALKFVIVVYLWSLDSWEKAHKSNYFRALKKCLIIKISIAYIDLISKFRAWSEFASILFLPRWANEQKLYLVTLFLMADSHKMSKMSSRIQQNTQYMWVYFNKTPPFIKITGKLVYISALKVFVFFIHFTCYIDSWVMRWYTKNNILCCWFVPFVQIQRILIMGQYLNSLRKTVSMMWKFERITWKRTLQIADWVPELIKFWFSSLIFLKLK